MAIASRIRPVFVLLAAFAVVVGITVPLAAQATAVSLDQKAGTPPFTAQVRN
jgi:hypothetical protein